jgi:hypothetical protein
MPCLRRFQRCERSHSLRQRRPRKRTRSGNRPYRCNPSTVIRAILILYQPLGGNGLALRRRCDALRVLRRCGPNVWIMGTSQASRPRAIASLPIVGDRGGRTCTIAAEMGFQPGVEVHRRSGSACHAPLASAAIHRHAPEQQPWRGDDRGYPYSRAGACKARHNPPPFF